MLKATNKRKYEASADAFSSNAKVKVGRFFSPSTSLTLFTDSSNNSNRKLITTFQENPVKKAGISIDLTLEEKEFLRQAKPKKITLADIVNFEPEDLVVATGISKDRCEEIIALAQFQLLGSVSKEGAKDFWQLGYKSLIDIEDANPKQMYQQFSDLVKRKVDPCVEDVFRCAIAQVKAASTGKTIKNYSNWAFPMFKQNRGKDDVSLEMEPISKQPTTKKGLVK